jgi:peroxiredoxin Q/BCP
MTQLRNEKETLVKFDIEVLIIGPEKSESFRKYWEKESLPFIGLPDPKHLVANLYGQQIKIFKLGRMPAQILIDKKGILLYSFYGNSMSDIPSIDEVINVLSN